MNETADAARMPVWDLPIRIMHWLLVLLVGASWWSAEVSELELHRWSGYAILFVLVLRVYWGFAGSSTARFSTFLKGPSVVLQYCRQLPARSHDPHAIGHNPLGGWSVVLLFGLLIAQVILGLFSVDVDGLESGPLSRWISFDAGRRIAHWHEWTFNILITSICLHVAAILFYLLYKRRNLLKPMVTGHMSVPIRDIQSWRRGTTLSLCVGIVLAALLVWFVVGWAPFL